MSEPDEPERSHAEHTNGAVSAGAWRGDALPVLAREATVLAAHPVATPAAKAPPALLVPIAQAAAAAAGGVVGGAARVGLARRRRRRVAAPRPRRGARAARRSSSGGRSGARPSELVHIVG